MRVNQKSWHYRLASDYGRGDFEFERSTDLCTYIRHFLIGILFWCGAVFLGSLFSAILIVFPAIWLLASFVDGSWLPLIDLAAIGVICDSIIGLMALFAWWAVYRQENHKVVVPMPNIVREAYRGWKEKYCPVIDLTPLK